ncbi:bifunctional nuclease family protein [Candidatus Bipolaricaulota bacterium]|nr:bifunctional nuclease family protein [Candidatus Bipolaricaulota bacterium]
MREAEIKALLVDPFNNSPVILLKDRNSDRAMPIWIGEAEAVSIAFGMQTGRFPRPLTHDLMKEIIDDLKGNVEKVVISAVKDGTFYATIFLVGPGGEQREIDARPSDSLALALRVGSPIFIADDVFESSSIESPFAEEDAFQDFVEYEMNLSDFRGDANAES